MLVPSSTDSSARSTSKGSQEPLDSKRRERSGNLETAPPEKSTAADSENRKDDAGSNFSKSSRVIMNRQRLQLMINTFPKARTIIGKGRQPATTIRGCTITNGITGGPWKKSSSSKVPATDPVIGILKAKTILADRTDYIRKR